MIRTPDSEAQHPVTCMLARAAGLLLWDCLFFPTSLCGVLTFGLSRSSSSSFSSSSSSSSPPPPLLLLCHPHGNPRHTRHTHCQHHALILMGTHHRTHYCHTHCHSLTPHIAHTRYCHSLSLTYTTHIQKTTETPQNALSRLLCGRPRALGGAHPLERSINATKRTLQAALCEAARAWARAPSGTLYKRH